MIYIYIYIYKLSSYSIHKKSLLFINRDSSHLRKLTSYQILALGLQKTSDLPYTVEGLPRWYPQVVKNLPANAGDTGDSGLIPGSGRSPGRRNGNPLQ